MIDSMIVCTVAHRHIIYYFLEVARMCGRISIQNAQCRKFPSEIVTHARRFEIFEWIDQIWTKIEDRDWIPMETKSKIIRICDPRSSKILIIFRFMISGSFWLVKSFQAFLDFPYFFLHFNFWILGNSIRNNLHIYRYRR